MNKLSVKMLILISTQFILAGSGYIYATEKIVSQSVRVMAGRSSYVFKVIEKSLKSVGASDKYEFLSRGRGDVSFARLNKLLVNSEHIDIAALGVTKNRLSELRAIKQPLMFGLQGYRILIIHKNQVDAFDKVTTLEQLRLLHAGFVNGWADTQIMKNNNLSIHLVPRASYIYAMLSRQRVDYFPRAVYEVSNNFNSISTDYPELIIEQKLALYYPLPVYLFVSKQNEKLAKQIGGGLKILLENGELKELFLRFNGNKIAELNLNQRRVLSLENDSLPSNIPIYPALSPPK